MKKRLEALWCALFRVNKNATGYIWPICRILLCLLSYWLLTVVNGSRPMSTPRAVVFVLLIVLTWGLFYGVICALVEISIVRKHRSSPKARQPVSGREKAAGKPFSLEQLAALDVSFPGIIRSCARDSANVERRLWAEREARAEKNMRAWGVDVTPLSEQEKQKFRAAVQPLYEKFAQWAELIERIQKA